MGTAPMIARTRMLSDSEVDQLDPYAFFETGPFDMMTPCGFLHDEGLMNSTAVMGRAMSRLSNPRKIAWLTPRVARAVPYLGFILVSGTRPVTIGEA